MKRLYIGVVSYRRPKEIHVLLRSLLCQTNMDFYCKIFHDGPDEEMLQILDRYQREFPDHIGYEFTDHRYNDYGHSLRQMAIDQADGQYLLLTNDDNYYVPIFIEEILRTASAHSSDVINFDMVHSHEWPGGRNQPPYTVFPTYLSRNNIDIGALVVNTMLAKKAGWRDHGYCGDATYCEDLFLAQPSLIQTKIDKVLFVHN